MKKFLLLTAVFLVAACNTNPPNFDDSEWGGVISPTDERNNKLNEFIDEYDGFTSIKSISEKKVEFSYKDGSKKILEF